MHGSSFPQRVVGWQHYPAIALPAVDRNYIAITAAIDRRHTFLFTDTPTSGPEELYQVVHTWLLTHTHLIPSPLEPRWHYTEMQGLIQLAKSNFYNADFTHVRGAPCRDYPQYDLFTLTPEELNELAQELIL